MTDKTTILVVGAGPTGLTMASELTRHGLQCRIIDKKDGITDKTKALTLQSRTMEVFEDMGLIQEVLETGRPVSGFSFYAEGEQIAHISSGELDTPYPYILLHPQSDTERSLNNHLNSLGVEVEWNTEIVELQQDNEELEVSLKHPDGTIEDLKPNYLIACDGGRSYCRKAIGAKLKGETFESEFIIADLELEWSNPPADDEWHGYFTDQGLVLIASLKEENKWRIMIEVPWEMQNKSESEPAYYQEPTFEDLKKMVEVLNPIPDLKLYEPTWISRFRIHRRIIDRFRYGSVFFAGDAAHLHSPAGGQGMNTGIQDAYNLAWKLRLVCRGIARPELLDSYNAERYPLSEQQVERTDAAFKMMLLRHPMSRKIRNRLFSLLLDLEPIQQRMDKRLAMLSINYRNSPIVDEKRTLPSPLDSPVKKITKFNQWRDFGEAPHAGDRVPDTTLIKVNSDRTFVTDRLFQILKGTSHHLVLFTGIDPTMTTFESFNQICSKVEWYFDNEIVPHLIVRGTEKPLTLQWNRSLLLDPEGDFHHRYGARSNCLYLIRPDKYIGFRSQPAQLEPLFEYCQRIFSKSLGKAVSR